MTQHAATRTGTREGSHQAYGWVRERDVMVAMRDGVRLAADVYRPALGGALRSRSHAA